jgi:hypothetical protein
MIALLRQLWFAAIGAGGGMCVVFYDAVPAMVHA